MPTENIPVERLDNLATSAVRKVFQDMVQEEVICTGNSCMLSGTRGDLLPTLPLHGGLMTIVVSFVGDVRGRVMLTMPRGAAEAFTLKLFDAPSLDWIGEDPREALLDSLGELGNMLAGLVKGGLTKWFPKLALTTPKVLVDKRMKVDNAAQSFRKQYAFSGFGSALLVDFSCG